MATLNLSSQTVSARTLEAQQRAVPLNEDTMQLAGRQRDALQAMEKVDFKSLKGLESKLSPAVAAHLLTSMRAELTAGGKVTSGYLSLHKSADGEFSLAAESRFRSAGNKAEAAELVKTLVNIAYGQALGQKGSETLGKALNAYLETSGGKLGTVSFVKLINQLEASTKGTQILAASAQKGRLNWTDAPATALSRDQSPVPKDFKQRTQDMVVGESILLKTSHALGAKAGVGVKAIYVAGVEVKAGAQVSHENKNWLKRTAEGFELTQHRFIGGGVSGESAATVAIELAGVEGSGSLGQFKEAVYEFANAEDAAAFLEKGGKGLTLAAEKPPKAGEFFIAHKHKGFAVKSETEVRYQAKFRALSASGQNKVTVDTTRYWAKDEAGHRHRADHRIYTSRNQHNSIAAIAGGIAGSSAAGKVVAQGFGEEVAKKVGVKIDAKVSRINTDAKLEFVSGSGAAHGHVMKPDLRFAIDASLVRACKDQLEVNKLVQSQFEQVKGMLQAANSDVGDYFDLSENGETQLRDVIQRSFDYVHASVSRSTELMNPADRAAAPQRAFVREDATATAVKGGLKLLGNGASVERMSGGMVTFKLPFSDNPNGSKRLSGNIDVGFTSKAMTKWEVSAGLDTPELPLPLGIKFETGVSGSRSSSRDDFILTDQLRAPVDRLEPGHVRLDA